jgi:hypothetical protein
MDMRYCLFKRQCQLLTIVEISLLLGCDAPCLAPLAFCRWPCQIATMTSRRPKRPHDPNQLGKLIVGLSTGELKEAVPKFEDSIASEFARLGGLKGGGARAAALSADERRRIAQRAAEARWKKDRK